MGARYWCNVCGARVAGGAAAVRTHRAGLHHQLLTRQHYHQYRELDEVVAEESRKGACERALRGEGRCVFGLLCRRTHYTPAELQHLQRLAAERREQAGRGRGRGRGECPRAEYERVRAAALQRERESGCSVLSGGAYCVLVPWRAAGAGRGQGQLPPSVCAPALEDFALECGWPPADCVYSALWASHPSPSAAPPHPHPDPAPP